MKNSIIALTVAILLPLAAQAGSGFSYRVKAGFNIGGASPMPIPGEIREIRKFTPTLALALGAEAHYGFSDSWGIKTGLKFENKAMSTHARVKSYKMAIDISEGENTGKASGYFTGDVKTKVRNEYLTIPVSAVWSVSPKWEVSAGVFTSILLGGGFSGEAFDPGDGSGAYIRDTNPTGEKIGVSSATYDFSKDIRPVNVGLQLGGQWNAYRQFSLYGDFTMAFNSIFKANFDTIGFAMYNIYMNIGFAYTF